MILSKSAARSAVIDVRNRAISNAKSEKSAEPRIPLDASEVTVEAMIPALFVRREIEEEIRDDQRASRNMQEEMLLEAWDT
jgi:hypothetical protein